MDYHFVTNTEYKKIVQCVLEVDPPSPADGTPWISPDEFLLPRRFHLLSTSQQLLLMRYFLTKGLTFTITPEEQWITWFYLTVGEEILPDIQDRNLERFCLLQIVPEFQGDFSLMDYVNCTNLALNDALRNNYRLPQSMYQHPNLIPYYKYCVSKETLDTETRNHMHHVLSLVEKSSFLGREILSITYDNIKTSVHPDERGFMLYQSKVN